MDYDADSDEEDTDEESKSPKKAEEHTEVDKPSTVVAAVAENKDHKGHDDQDHHPDQEYMEEEKQSDENNDQSGVADADDVGKGFF